MVNDAQVFLAGYVATGPTFKKVAGGISFVKLRIAYTARRLNREAGEWADGPTSFVGVQCWRGLADNVAMCLRKGEPILVRGRLQVRRYENAEGSPRIAVEVDATSIGHDLTRGVAHFSRTRRSVGESASQFAGAQASAQPGEGIPGPEEGEDPKAPAPEPSTGSEPAEDHSGDGVVDEGAVDELARELAATLTEDREVKVPL